MTVTTPGYAPGMDRGGQLTLDLGEDLRANWWEAGLDALYVVCQRLPVFKSSDVWVAWHGPQPDPPNRIAEILDEGIRQGWCVRRGPVGGHPRRAGNEGFGAQYTSRLTDRQTTPG